MSLYADPETHAANPPESWEIRKHCDRIWYVVDARGDVLDRFETRRAALEAVTTGHLRKFYDNDGRWYAGETPHGMRSWAECKAERERMAARRAAKACA